ncbi:MAG: SpoIIE family protein phosphatase [Flavobacteriales bacterium]|nr:SpoIIE family protein phosphatase [Flavobacteriales bacterium]
MELSLALTYGALPVLLLGASVGISYAYDRLRGLYNSSERDRTSYLDVLESSNDAFFVIDFVDGRIHQANARAAALLGYSRGEFKGLTIFQLHPREYIGISAERIADAWERKGLVYEDIPLLTSIGEVIPVESSTRVISYQGRPAIILFARDIRERLALQREVERQQSLVMEQNRELLSSIRYAKRIQQAVLPEAERLQELFPESFILHRPRDIVSGDLYWFAQRDKRLLVAAADCTGHGVPGALLSLIGASLFEETVLQKGLVRPAAVLNELRNGMVQALNRQADEAATRDGMNVCLVSIDPDALLLEHAGAHGPLYVVRSGELIEVKGDRMPIGMHEGAQGPFTGARLQLQRGDRIYLFSDGLQDQFGGALGRKLKSSGLRQWLLETATLTMDEQHQAISDRFRLWKGTHEQVDDVLLIGLQV